MQITFQVTQSPASPLLALRPLVLESRNAHAHSAFTTAFEDPHGGGSPHRNPSGKGCPWAPQRGCMGVTVDSSSYFFCGIHLLCVPSASRFTFECECTCRYTHTGMCRHPSRTCRGVCVYVCECMCTGSACACGHLLMWWGACHTSVQVCVCVCTCVICVCTYACICGFLCTLLSFLCVYMRV